MISRASSQCCWDIQSSVDTGCTPLRLVTQPDTLVLSRVSSCSLVCALIMGMYSSGQGRWLLPRLLTQAPQVLSNILNCGMDHAAGRLDILEGTGGDHRILQQALAITVIQRLRAMRQYPNLIGNNCKPAPILTGPCCLNAGIQSQQNGLFDDTGELLAFTLHGLVVCHEFIQATIPAIKGVHNLPEPINIFTQIKPLPIELLCLLILLLHGLIATVLQAMSVISFLTKG